ncbi:P-loop NTPase fold protein [Marinomonas posidonica]|uniref:P-loop NTPase fold protein n=1 Tax=Marinomonas posidonica TaxID=936476 RepID=UPI0037362C6C
MDLQRAKEQVIEYLFDESFPPIVLLSGEWGSGKTHFVKNYLMDAPPEEYRVSYISLYGISSIDDFRDRVLSNAYVQSEYRDKGQELYDGLKSSLNITGIVAKFFGDGGLTSGILNALGKPIKHSLLSRISKLILIVDDLERTSTEKLIGEVLGECLNLVEGNDNFRVVVVANEKHITNKDVLEKTFLNRTFLAVSSKDMMAFVDSEYKSLLCPITKAILSNSIDSLSLTNYRVLHRILHRYKLLKRKIDGQGNSEIDVIPSLSKLIEHITLVCNAHFVHGFSKDELLSRSQRSGFNNSLVKEADKDVSQESRKELFSKIMQSSFGQIENYLIYYCLDLSTIPDDFINLFGLSLKTDPVDKLLSFTYQNMNNEDFSQLVQYTKDQFLFIDTPKSIVKWARVLDTLVYFAQNEYIAETKKELISHARIKSNVEGFFRLEDSLNSYDISVRSFEDVEELYNERKKLVVKSSRAKGFSILQERLVESWEEVSNDIFKVYDHKPFLDAVDISVLVKGIVDNWTYNGVIVFGQFLAARYKSSTIYEYLIDEFDAVKSLESELDKCAKVMSESLKKGRIMELLRYLREAIEYIDNSEKQKLEK